MYLSEGLIQSYLTGSDMPEEDRYAQLISCMRIGSYLERALHTDSHEDCTAVELLYQERLLHPNEAIMLIHVIFLPPKVMLLPMDMSRADFEQLQSLLQLLRPFCRVDCFCDVSRLLLLLHSSRSDLISQDDLDHLLTLFLHHNPDVDRIVASEWKQTPAELFHAYNSVVHYEEYQRFIQFPARISHVQQNAQMFTPFTIHTQHFDHLCNDLTAAMLRQDFDSAFWSGKAVSLILQSAVGSMEAIHRCMQTFVSSLTHCLLAHRFLDAKDVDHGQMLDTVMKPGHNEQAMREAIRCLMEDIYYRRLTFEKRTSANRVREVCKYISDHISDYDLSVPALSRYCGVNRNLLSADFKKYTGISLSGYLIEARVRYAKRLMAENPALTLSEIASQAGYTSLSTMYRNFQAIEGCSPGTCRKRPETTCTE